MGCILNIHITSKLCHPQKYVGWDTQKTRAPYFGVRVCMNILKQFSISILALIACNVIAIFSAGMFNQPILAPIILFLGMLYSLHLMIKVDDKGGLVIAIGIIIILSSSLFNLIFSIFFDGLCATKYCV